MSVDLIWILAGVGLAILLEWRVLRRRPRLRASSAASSEAIRPGRGMPRWLLTAAELGRGVVSEFKRQPLAVTLFGFALLVYALTRLIGLDKFPIYFFCDEAAPTVLAADLVRNGLSDASGHFLPTFFKNGFFYSLGTTVYLQAISYAVFGKSVVATRGVSVLMSLSGAAAVGLTLKEAFKARWWWAGVMLLSITPAWFLHSRTAFETVTMASLYAWFVYFYALYRQRDPRYLFPALLLGALAFYSYNPGRVVVVVSGVLLLASDWRYHWANRKIGGWGLAFLGVLALPYVRFWLQYPEEQSRHLRLVGSYWLQNWTLPQKLSQFWSEYTLGLDPRYWYWPTGTRDLARHTMRGYGHILLATLPLAALGLVVCLRQWRSSAHRLVLIALLAAPAGGALAAIGITRVLALVTPAILLTALGLEAIQGWIARRISTAWLAVGVFVALSVVNVSMLRDALVNGPTWYTDYGVYGMQYGAEQVFAEITAYLQQSPEALVLLSPMWATGPGYLVRFFMNDDPRVRLDRVKSYLSRRQPLSDNLLFVMTPEEYREALASPKLKDIRVERTLPYPDGRPGFYFVHLRYSSAADSLFANEKLTRPELAAAALALNGETMRARYSALDFGQIQDVFDGSFRTFGLVNEADPAIVELTFPSPREVSRVSVIVTSLEFNLKALLYADENGDPVIYSQDYNRWSPGEVLTLSFKPVQVAKLQLEMQSATGTGYIAIYIHDIMIQ